MAKTENLVLRLEQKMLKELSAVSRELGMSKSEAVRRSIEDFLWRMRFDRARRRTIQKARRQGLITEDDVFRAVS